MALIFLPGVRMGVPLSDAERAVRGVEGVDMV